MLNKSVNDRWTANLQTTYSCKTKFNLRFTSIAPTYPADMNDLMLNTKLERIRSDYRDMVGNLEKENDSDQAEQNRRQRRETEELETKQLEERRRFDLRQTREKEKVRQRQDKQREEMERRMEQRKRELDKFIESIHSPSSPTLGLQTRREMECPVCLAEMKPPMKIWQCSEGHPVCESCHKRPQLNSTCPTCRRPVSGRNILAEKISRALFGEEDRRSEEGLQDRDIQMVMVQANQQRDVAVMALNNNNNNILDAISELTK